MSPVGTIYLKRVRVEARIFLTLFCLNRTAEERYKVCISLKGLIYFIIPGSLKSHKAKFIVRNIKSEQCFSLMRSRMLKKETALVVIICHRKSFLYTRFFLCFGSLV